MGTDRLVTRALSTLSCIQGSQNAPISLQLGRVLCCSDGLCLIWFNLPLERAEGSKVLLGLKLRNFKVVLTLLQNA